MRYRGLGPQPIFWGDSIQPLAMVSACNGAAMWPRCTLTGPALPQAPGFGLGLSLRVHFPCFFFPYPLCLLRQLSSVWLSSHFSELQLCGEDPRLWNQILSFKSQLFHSVAGQPSVNCLSSLCLSFLIWLLRRPLYGDDYKAPDLWSCSRSCSLLAA